MRISINTEQARSERVGKTGEIDHKRKLGKRRDRVVVLSVFLNFGDQRGVGFTRSTKK